MRKIFNKKHFTLLMAGLLFSTCVYADDSCDHISGQWAGTLVNDQSVDCNWDVEATGMKSKETFRLLMLATVHSGRNCQERASIEVAGTCADGNVSAKMMLGDATTKITGIVLPSFMHLRSDDGVTIKLKKNTQRNVKLVK